MPEERSTAASGDDARDMARLLWRFEIMRRAEEQAEPLRSAEGRLLWLLTQGNAPLTLKQIANELELEQSTANRQVNSALRAGLLHRFREPGASAGVFEATDDGVALYERSLQRHLTRVRAALDAVPQEQRTSLVEAFTTLIEAYADHVEADETAATEPPTASQNPPI